MIDYDYCNDNHDEMGIIIDKKVILRCSSEDSNNETLPNQDKEGSQFMNSSLKGSSNLWKGFTGELLP